MTLTHSLVGARGMWVPLERLQAQANVTKGTEQEVIRHDEL